MVLKKKKLSKSKNVSALPAKEDFSVLDSAVSELAKQTEALLGKTGEKMTRPVLPKKESESNSKAKSFDIIHNPDGKKRSEALLKAPHPGQKLLEADDSDEPDTSDSKVVTKSKPEATVASGLSAHTPGALKFAGGKTIEPIVDGKQAKKSNVKSPSPKPIPPAEIKELEAQEDQNLTPDAVEADEDIKITDDSTDGNITEVDISNHKSISNVDNDDDTEISEVDSGMNKAEVSIEDDGKTDGVGLGKQGDSNKSKGTDSSQKIQLFSDNLDDSKSDDDEDGPQPEIFDTDEYHPTLHDWSKLEHQSAWPKVVLLVLLVILAAGVYIIVSGVKLPFLP